MATYKRFTHESRWFEEMFDSFAWLDNMGHQRVPVVEKHHLIYCYIKLYMLPILGFLYYQGHPYHTLVESSWKIVFIKKRVPYRRPQNSGQNVFLKKNKELNSSKMIQDIYSSGRVPVIPKNLPKLSYRVTA